MPRAETPPKLRDHETRDDVVVIQWGTGRAEVEIGTTRPAARTGATHVPDFISPDHTEPLDGWFVPLDRDGINKLIRNLRRARDAAYGADA